MKTSAPLHWRLATAADCPLLAELNHQLIRDEGHRNTMNPAQLEERMRSWLQSGEYTAVLFEREGIIVAYTLYRESAEEVYLRQLLVVRPHRREGIGRQAAALLREQIWPRHKRLTLEVLSHNTVALAFWRSLGYRDYSVCLEIMPEP